MPPSQQTDVVIIGAGPVGLFQIFELGMLGFRCHVIDALDHVGGQCRALYPEKPIYDIPAYPKILATELVDHLVTQAAPFKPVYHLNQRVNKITEVKPDGQWIVESSEGLQIRCKAIVIAAGVGAFGPNRPPLENIEAYEGKSIFYHVEHPRKFEKKRLLLAGGGDSCVDWAINLVDIAQKVMVVHRRDRFRAAPDSVAKLRQLTKEGRIELLIPYQLGELKGENDTLKEVILYDLDGNKRAVETDILLPFFGLSMDLGPILSWGLNLDHSHIAIDPLTGQTNLPGIYAVGDIATYQHKLKLILTGFAEAAQAAHAIRQHIFPNEAFHFQHSTTQGVPSSMS